MTEPDSDLEALLIPPTDFPELSGEIEWLRQKIVRESLKEPKGFVAEVDEPALPPGLALANRAKLVGVLASWFVVIETEFAERNSRVEELDARAKALNKVPELTEYLVATKSLRKAQAAWRVLGATLDELSRRSLDVPEAVAIQLIEWSAARPFANSLHPGIVAVNVALAVAGPQNRDGAFSNEVIQALQKLAEKLACRSDYRRQYERLLKWIEGEERLPIDPGEAWSDAARGEYAAMAPVERAAWLALFIHCAKARGSKPSTTWIQKARDFLRPLDRSDFKDRVRRWFLLLDHPRTAPPTRTIPWVVTPDTIESHHADILRGLAWCTALDADADLARALSTLAQSAYRRVPPGGVRMPTIGNAVVSALGLMPGLDSIAQLALLKVKIKFLPAQKEIAKALEAAAAREGLPPDEIEELAVPAYGFSEVGRRVEVMGDHQAELIAEGADVTLRWSTTAGKPLKSVPAAVKKEHAADLKELQAAAKDAAKMLSAQRQRIDALFLSRRSWPLDTWRDRYLDHPLVGVVARRLIWRIENAGHIHDAIWHNGRLVDADDHPVDIPAAGTTVRLWHPLDVDTATTLAWRAWLERHEVRQPFKQAHREVYLLTDAERTTNTYSNRFAAHILRQHQFHALAQARGWRNQLRLLVDATYAPAHKILPEWGLRAEYWVEGIGGEFGTDTLDSGAFRFLSTDQVRFYEIAAAQRIAHAGGGGYHPDWRAVDVEPVPLAQVPPLVLSEILRDVDLFVGVASVGNDPNWADGGPNGQFVDYWHNYSFGDLGETGRTRRAVLECLIPRLKIASRCTLGERYLAVRGDIRTYRIHLGSGNIMMDPDDRYLCIVPGRSEEQASDRVFLPFEGDRTLSIILSKALMLADDKKIKDPSIMRQIQPR